MQKASNVRPTENFLDAIEIAAAADPLPALCGGVVGAGREAAWRLAVAEQLLAVLEQLTADRINNPREDVVATIILPSTDDATRARVRIATRHCAENSRAVPRKFCVATYSVST